MAYSTCSFVHLSRRSAGLAASMGFFALALAMTGCAGLWEELSSHERDWSYVTGVGKPHPLTVIEKTTDGARRAEALGRLKEPILNGGNAQDQDAYLRILGTAAQTDAQPLCRLTAIRALGKYKDPRAARHLEEVYQQRNMHPISMPDQIAMIRKEALVALEQTGDKDARHLLIRVARQPGPSLESNLTDRQQTQDEKLIAIRALSKYRDAETVEALKYVMRSEKDVALRHRTLESLEIVTGKKWPSHREAWLNEDQSPQPLPGGNEKNPILRVGAWFKN